MTEETPLIGQDSAAPEIPQTTVEKTDKATSALAGLSEMAESSAGDTPQAPSTALETAGTPPQSKKKKRRRKGRSESKSEAASPQKKDKFYIPVEVGQKMMGKIKTITDFGAFVDLNLTVDGLVHISEMSRRRIEKVSDIISKGDEVEVWVKSVNRERGRVGLTMLKPLKYKYRDIKEDAVLDGEVKRIENYGIFVDVGLEREGLVHVSELSHEYVKSPEEVIAVGDTVKVKVLKIDSKKKQINLSIKSLLDLPELEVVEKEVIEEAPEEEVALEEDVFMSTTMAAAFGKLDSFKKPSRKKASKRRRRNRAMDRVVARTLQVGQQE